MTTNDCCHTFKATFRENTKPMKPKFEQVQLVPGKDGEDGVTPHIGENGNWWLGEADTGVKAAGKDGLDGKDGYAPQKGVDYFDGAPGRNGVDGFSPVVSVEDISGGHRVTITDKDGAKTFDVLDGKDGQGGAGGTNADWSVNDPQAPGYVKNRTHWAEDAFVPITFSSEQSAQQEKIDLSAYGLGVFYKVSDTLPNRELLERANVAGWNEKTAGVNGQLYYLDDISQTLGTDAYDWLIFNNNTGEDFMAGWLIWFPENVELLGIPFSNSAGAYMSCKFQPITYHVTISNRNVTKLDAEFIPDSVLLLPTVSLVEENLRSLMVDGESREYPISSKWRNIILGSNRPIQVIINIEGEIHKPTLFPTRDSDSECAMFGFTEFSRRLVVVWLLYNHGKGNISLKVSSSFTI